MPPPPIWRRSPGICDAIFAAADTRALTAACKKLRRCPVGTAVVTPSFGLPCKYIIHVALGEWMGDLRTGKRLMEACYRHAMQQALMCPVQNSGLPPGLFRSLSSTQNGGPHSSRKSDPEI